MTTDYITLAGKDYRVEVNWNAITAFLEARGTVGFEALTDIDQLKITDVAPLMAAAINEGERLDGRPSQLTGLDLGAMPGFMAAVPAFLRIYAKQAAPMTGAQPEGEAPGKKD